MKVGVLNKESCEVWGSGLLGNVFYWRVRSYSKCYGYKLGFLVVNL